MCLDCAVANVADSDRCCNLKVPSSIPAGGTDMNQNQNHFISEVYNVSNIKINLLLMGANSWKPI